MHIFSFSFIEWEGLKIIFLKTYKRNVEGKEIEEKREKCFLFIMHSKSVFFGIASSSCVVGADPTILA